MSPVIEVCPTCRARVADGELFCEGCGADLSAAVPAPAGPLPPAGAVPGPPTAVDPAVADPAAVDAAAADPASADPGAADPADPVVADPATDPVADPVADPAGGGPGPTAAWVRVDEQDLSVRAGYCVHCRGPVADDGYCSRCGAPAPLPRDHWRERPAPWVAAVCDRGVRHPHNEDAVAVAAAPSPGSFAALVVCDGVSSSSGSDRASLAAVRAAREVLVAAAVPPADGSAPGPARTPGSGPMPTPQQRARAEVLAAALVDAGLCGNAAVVATAGDPPGPNPPSCTFVAAVVEDALVVVGGVGDSRAYWLPDTGPAEQLSADDSWAGEAIAAGIPREDAERAPQAHAITRWFGVDAPDPRPRTAARVLDCPGWVLVCSDGLWNYCSPAADLQGLLGLAVRQVGDDPAEVAAALVDWAKQQGGHDNITVALARVQPLPTAG